MSGPDPKTPRRGWLVGIVAAAVAAGIGWSRWRRRRALGAEVGKGVPVLLDFGMDICEQCKKTRALLQKIQPEYFPRLQIQFVDVRDDANDALVQKYGVRIIPLLVLLNAAGQEVWRHEGFAEESVLRNKLDHAIGSRTSDALGSKGEKLC